MEITRLSIDLAKTSFYVCGKNERNEVVLDKKISAGKLRKLLVDLKPCIVFMESCGGSNYWGNFAQSHGHTCKLIAPQHVKPYVTSGQKNDRNDALAILEAAARPNQYFQKPKSPFFQKLQALLKNREFAVQTRVSLTNHIRGYLLEQGLDVRVGDKSLKEKLVEIGSSSSDPHEIIMMQNFLSMLNIHEEQITQMTKQIETLANETPVAKRLQEVPGIGALSAAWYLSFVGDGSQFKNGRQASACLGLVPRQSSTGGRQKLYGITKRGNVSVRTVLIHGARSYARAVALKGPMNKRDEWVYKLIETKGMNKAATAIANKNARILWAMVSRGEEYKIV